MSMVLKQIYRRLWHKVWKIRAWKAGGLQEGEFFPDFSLLDLQGKKQTLSESFPDKHTVLWLTNLCEDCQSKIPLLENLQKEAGDRTRILAISLLGAEDTLPRRIGKSCGFSFLLDPSDIVAHELGLEHPPATCPLHNLFIIDPHGRIAFRHHLSALDERSFRTAWKKALDGNGWIEKEAA